MLIKERACLRLCGTFNLEWHRPPLRREREWLGLNTNTLEDLARVLVEWEDVKPPFLGDILVYRSSISALMGQPTR